MLRRMWLPIVLLLGSGIFSAALAEGARLAYLIEQTRYLVEAREVVRKSHGKDIAAALRPLGFAVQKYENLNAEEFARALAEIFKDSQGAEAAIIYVSAYALGHTDDGGGVLPTDLAAARPVERAVSVRSLLETPQADDLRLVIIDAPEDAGSQLGLDLSPDYSPFLSQPASVPKDTIGVITSVAPWGGYTGLRPISRTHLFPRNFKLFLQKPGRSARDLLNKVAISTFYESQHRQYPAFFGGPEKPYVFTRQDEVSDITAWLELLARPTKDGLTAFIKANPDSIYVEFARKKLEELEKLGQD
ncbi:MAG: caspase family protein [Pseudomonadota bacterium]